MVFLQDCMKLLLLSYKKETRHCLVSESVEDKIVIQIYLNLPGHHQYVQKNRSLTEI